MEGLVDDDVPPGRVRSPALPPTPRGLVAGYVLPSATNGSLVHVAGSSDPGPLAIAPNGGLLVSDVARNQILEWRDGSVSVVAGDGIEGFSGDGGPALDAELNDPANWRSARTGQSTPSTEGTSWSVASPAGTITTVAGDGSTGEGADVGDGEAATDVPLTPSGVAVARDDTLYVSSGSDIRTVAPDGVISTLVRGGAALRRRHLGRRHYPGLRSVVAGVRGRRRTGDLRPSPRRSSSRSTRWTAR